MSVHIFRTIVILNLIQNSSANLHGPALEQKMFRDRDQTEPAEFWAGTEPETGPVQSLNTLGKNATVSL